MWGRFSGLRVWLRVPSLGGLTGNHSKSFPFHPRQSGGGLAGSPTWLSYLITNSSKHTSLTMSELVP